MSILTREDRTAGYWDDAYEQGAAFRPVSPFEERMLHAYVDPVPGMTVLEVGCGHGDYAAFLARSGLHVDAVDFSRTALEEARARHAGAGTLRFHLHDFNVAQIPGWLRPASVDLVVCRLSLAFLDRQRFLGDVRRWLKPDGVLHITTSVDERTAPAQQHRGLRQSDIDRLSDGWCTATRYDLEGDGSLTCVVLRGPHAPRT
ncbi:class I SAM-dependent methyltransferase [Streptomyces niveus]|uniref:class I SAM-dependent methyltransferase n=1 Tax=Streptomyces niveus TaxID=193462 RepID=UPI0036B8B811